jgi:hypothetical protein
LLHLAECIAKELGHASNMSRMRRTDKKGPAENDLAPEPSKNIFPSRLT